MKYKVRKIAILMMIVAIFVAAKAQEKVDPDNQPPTLIVQTGHSSAIKTLWFSADEKNLISQSDDRIIIWDVKNAGVLQSIEKQTIYELSAQSGILVTSDLGENKTFWEIKTGRKLYRLEDEKECAFNLSGKYLVCQNNKNLITVRNPVNAEILRKFDLVDRDVSTFAFGWNDTILISSLPKDEPKENEPRNFLEVYEIKTDEPVFSLNNQTHWGISDDGKLLVSKNIEDTLKIYNLADKFKEIFTENKISDWKFSSDNRYISTSKEGKTINVWDIATKQIKFTKEVQNYNNVYFVPNNKFVYYSEDEKIYIHNLEKGVQQIIIEGYLDKFSPDGKFVTVGNYVNDQKRTFSMWNVETKKLVFKTPETENYVNYVGFSNDGKTLTANYNLEGFSFWDTQTGKEKTISLKDEVIAPTVDIDSPLTPPRMLINRTVGSNTTSKKLTIYLTKDNKKLLAESFNDYDTENRIKFINQDRTLVRGLENGVVGFWDVSDGKKTFTLEKHASPIRASVSEDKKSLLIEDGYFEKVWNYQNGGFSEIKEAVDPILGNIYGLPTEENTDDSGSAYDIYDWDFVDRENQPGVYYLKDKKTQKTIFQFDKVSDCEVNYEGTLFGCYRYLEGDEEQLTAEIYDIKTKKLLFQIPEAIDNYEFENGLFKVDDNRIFVERLDKTKTGYERFENSRLEIWSLAGKPVFVTESGLNDYQLDDNTENLVLGFDDRLEWHNLKTGKVKDFVFQGDFYISLERTNPIASPSGNHLVLTSEEYENRIYVWNNVTGRIFWRTEHSAKIISVEFSPDEKFLFTAGEDGTVRVWDIFKEKLVLTLIPLDEKDWVVVDADGRFDASEGAAKLMEWRVGNDSISFEQLKERYYEPNLWQKILGFSKEPLRDVSALKNVLLPPEVIIESPTKQNSSVRNVRLKNKGGGIGRVQVFVNGREFIEDARDEKLKANPNVQEYVLSFDLKNAPVITGEMPDVKVVAWNFDKNAKEKYQGYISSRGVEVFYIPEDEKPIEPPTLYAIIGGVSDYKGSELDLRYAAKDAEDMFKALQIGGKNLFGVDKINLKLLATGENPNAIPPTKENFRKAYEEFAKVAKPNDIFFVYLSGHGITLSFGSDTYYYLTQEATTTDKQQLGKDSELLKSSTISSEELTAWHKSVKALKQVLILDTCAAGALGNEFKIVEKKDLSTDAKRALENMKDRVGFHVLMGSAADAVSYEASQYGQGLLTYSLLEGMKGAALLEDKKVDISKLFNYAADRVPQLAKNIGGIQRPEIRVPEGGASFAIGLIRDENDKKSIPLANVKPLILRPVLQNRQLGFDNLKLTTLLRDEIREASFITERGKDISTMVFVDTDEMPDAIIPAGNYIIEGDKIKFTINLVRNNEAVKTFEVVGDKNDLATTVKALFEKVSEEIRGLSP